LASAKAEGLKTVPFIKYFGSASALHCVGANVGDIDGA
jgi:hypothetical protein